MNVYPLGYFKTANQIETNPKIKVERKDFSGNSATKDIDFVFAVPVGLHPALVEFKLNNIVQIPINAVLTDSAEAPPAAVMDQSSENQRPDRPQEPEPSEETDQVQPEPQSPGNPTTEPNDNQRQSRVENLTESVTGMGLDEGL